MKLTRRTLGASLGAVMGGALLAAARSAGATQVRGLTLAELVKSSGQITVMTPTEAASRWTVLGGSKIIVTDTRVRVEESLRSTGAPTEMTVRTLGGQIGDEGELVFGQPELRIGAAGVAFLLEAEGVHWVVGMAQGHFPLTQLGSARVLLASRSLPRMRHFVGSAVQTLANKRLSEARELIRAAGAP